ncbi:branched-chain amino acid ABC transporter permease [Ornithinimicrobium cryptoxanthini]|uniref:Branched-chain amino acid ABC transporter permease n=1 Tax=Ornithinimicrobium cryptoxanthini TaxID=2934161 RepID=A0ABY4YEE7_9MICO|nr:branched-chain amino acid ABC transporter permease [Ornithinimicrobium cryptoxanthini]USQ74940.1 branched-chain amino acid ABC transporter permease [Ornithinimicrobium cryptoxanthini]
MIITACFVVLLQGAAPASAQGDGSEVGLDDNDYSITANVRFNNEPVQDVRIVVSGGGYEAEALTNERGQVRVGVPTTDGYDVLIDEETLPEGVAVEGENTQSVAFGSQFFAPANFFLGEDVRETASFLSQFVERLMNGINFGLMLALASIGLSLIFGTTGLTNFAHAEMVTFGAIFALWMVMIDLPILVAIVLAVIASGIFGWLFDASLWRPLRRRGIGLVQMMILTIGFSLALRYIFLMLIGGGTTQLPGSGGVKHQIIGPIQLSTIDMVSMGLSLLVLLAVSYWLLRTRIGKATRAVADNRQLAAASGINVERVTRIVWVIGGALAGLSGVLWAYFRPGIKWDMGMQILLLIFAAVVLGGLGTAFGALVGSLVIGILVEVSTLWIPSDIKYVGALGVLVIVLLVRPQGLLGRRERVG